MGDIKPRKSDTVIEITDRIVIRFMSSIISVFANCDDCYEPNFYDWNFASGISAGGANHHFQCHKTNYKTISNDKGKVFDLIREHYPQDFTFILFHPEIFEGRFYE